jgi:hypothetical protein
VDIGAVSDVVGDGAAGRQGLVVGVGVDEEQPGVSDGGFDPNIPPRRIEVRSGMRGVRGWRRRLPTREARRA